MGTVIMTRSMPGMMRRMMGMRTRTMLMMRI